MTRKSSCHLLDMLAKLEDPRKDKGKRHPLKSIFTLMVIGLMCGHKGYTSIATWARSQPALAKALGFTKKITPCASTLHNLLKKLDVVALEETLLNGYLDWPGIAQVIQYRYTYKNLNTAEETHKVHYGVTSLNPEEASAERLLTLRRGHWSIENKSH